MAMPYRPSDFEALQIREDESFCSALIKLLKLSVYLWKHVKWKYKSPGVFSDEYAAMICGVDCSLFLSRQPTTTTTS